MTVIFISLLALVDAIRVGRIDESILSSDELKQILLKMSHQDNVSRIKVQYAMPGENSTMRLCLLEDQLFHFMQIETALKLHRN